MPIISMADDIIFFFERVKEMHLCSLSILSIVIPLFTYGHSKKVFSYITFVRFSANCSRHTVLEVEKQFHPIHVIITKTTGITIAILLIHKEIIIHASSFIIIKNREKKN